MQAQIQALLAVGGGVGTGGMTMGSNLGPHMEVAKLAIFNREAGKVRGFITACRLFLRMKLRGATVEKQVQWVLSYESVEEFLTSLKKEFGGGEEELVKAVELRRMKQGGKTMEEFV